MERDISFNGRQSQVITLTREGGQQKKKGGGGRDCKRRQREIDAEEWGERERELEKRSKTKSKSSGVGKIPHTLRTYETLKKNK